MDDKQRSYLYPNHEQILFRQNIIQDIVQQITDSASTTKIVIVFGSPGSGKTKVCKAVISYVAHRLFFFGGIHQIEPHHNKSIIDQLIEKINPKVKSKEEFFEYVKDK